MSDRPVSVPMTLSDLERWDARVKMFQEDLRNNARTVWSRTTKFGRKTHVRRGICIGVSHALSQRDGATGLPIFGVPSIYAYIIWRRTARFDEVTHILVFSGQPHPNSKRRGPSTPQFWGFSMTAPIAQNAHVPQGVICRWRVLLDQPRLPSQESSSAPSYGVFPVFMPIQWRR